MILDLVVLFVVLVVAALTLLGWGYLTHKFLAMTVPVPFSMSTVWVGLTSVIFVSSLWHLFLPLNWFASLVFVTVGLWSLRSFPSDVCKDALTRTKNLRKYTLLIFCCAVMFLVWCMRAMASPNNFDSALYHFGSIRWLNEWAIVPGLSNVHWRFGFNQTYFNFLALLNIFPVWNKGYAAGGLLLNLLAMLTVLEIARKETRDWIFVWLGCTVVFLGNLASVAANPAPDSAVAVLEVMVMLYLYRLLSCRSPRPLTKNVDVLPVVLLSVALITIKLSSGMFALGALLAAVLIQVNQADEFISTDVVRLSLLAVMTLCVYMVRGWVLSGYPVFPLAIGMSPTISWSFPPEVLQYETQLIYSWARAPGVLDPRAVLVNWDWLSPWLTKVPLAYWISVVISTLCAITQIVWIVTRSEKRSYLTLTLYIPILFGFIFWFITAPDLRFLGAIVPLYLIVSVWGLSQTGLINKLRGWSKLQSISAQFSILKKLFVIGILLVLVKGVGVRSLSYSGWQEIPEYETETKLTASELSVQVPKKDAICWDAPLPCVSVFTDRLMMTTLRTNTTVVPKILDRPIFKLNH